MQQQQEMAIASNARGMMMRDHDGQFGYRVQPIQPNLQEKIMSLVIDWSLEIWCNLITNLLSNSWLFVFMNVCVSIRLLFSLHVCCLLMKPLCIGCVVCQTKRLKLFNYCMCDWFYTTLFLKETLGNKYCIRHKREQNSLHVIILHLKYSFESFSV